MVNTEVAQQERIHAAGLFFAPDSFFKPLGGRSMVGAGVVDQFGFKERPIVLITRRGGFPAQRLQQTKRFILVASLSHFIDDTALLLITPYTI